MNYIKELNAFRDWVMTNQVSTGQVALWHSLMSINNMTGWKEWFTVPNQTLQLMTGLSRQGLDKARNGLIQQGRFEYKKGKSNQAGRYRLCSFYECQKVGTVVGTVVGAIGAPQLSQEEHQSSTLLKHKLNETKSSSNSNEMPEREKNPFWIFENEGFGTISDLIAQKINYMIDDYSERWVIEAMKLAIYQNKRSISYVEGILKRWKAEGIDTPWEGGKKGEKHNGNNKPDYTEYKFGF
jgi:DnaD/phage-associated family protein